MLKKRINGQLLGQHVGDQIILMGSINKKSANGMNLELKTTDNMIVNVAMPEAIDGNLDGYLEVHGTVKSKTTMSCSSYVHFRDETTAGFDVDQYNDLIMLMKTLGSSLWKMSDVNTVF